MKPTAALRRRLVVAARAGIDALPATSRELALALATRSGHGPAMLPGPPDGPVLVVAPHPDDEAIGPGGTLARHADAGHEVRVLVVTSGGATAGGDESVLTRREAETRRALGRLGVGADVVFGHLDDGRLHRQVDRVAELISLHAQGRRTVYLPSLLDHHPDHHAVALAAAQADLAEDTILMGYEVWTASPVDVLVDVTDVFSRKQAALAEYRTALATVDYVRSASGLAAYRSAEGGLGGRGFAEGFTRCTVAEHRARAAALPEP